MEKQKLIFIIIFMFLIGILFFIFVIPIVNAQPVGIQNTEFNLKIPCSNNGSFCSLSTVCNITIFNPNGIEIINNVEMSQNISTFNISLDKSYQALSGEYDFTICCNDLGTTKCKSLYYTITPNGEIPDISKSILNVALLAILIVLFIMCLFRITRTENYGWTLGFASFSYILFLSILFISYQLSTNYLTSIPYISTILYISFFITLIMMFPLFIVSVVYLLSKVTSEREINKLVDMGYTREEAQKTRKNK